MQHGMFGADTGKVDSGATLFAIPNTGFAFNMGNITAGMSICGQRWYEYPLQLESFIPTRLRPAIRAFAGVLGGIAPTVAAGYGEAALANAQSTRRWV